MTLDVKRAAREIALAVEAVCHEHEGSVHEARMFEPVLRKLLYAAIVEAHPEVVAAGLRSLLYTSRAEAMDEAHEHALTLDYAMYTWECANKQLAKLEAALLRVKTLENEWDRLSEGIRKAEYALRTGAPGIASRVLLGFVNAWNNDWVEGMQ